MIKLKGTDRFFPPGFEYIPELRRALAAYSAAFIAAAIGYLWRFDTAFDALYIFEDRVKKLIPGAVMDDFCDLALPGMNLFPPFCWSWSFLPPPTIFIIIRRQRAYTR